MANNINDMLASLLLKAGRGAKKAVTDSDLDIAGLPGIAALGGILRAQQGREAGLNVTPTGVGGALSNASALPEARADEILAEEVEKASRKQIRGTAETLLQQGVSPKTLIETTEGFGARKGMAKPQQQQAPQELQQEPPQQQGADVNKLLGFLGKSVDKAGNIPSDFFEGFSQALGVTTPKAAEREATLEGQKFAQKLALENFKQDRLDQREALKNQLKDSGASDIQTQSAVMSMDIQDLIDARSQVGATGPVMGRVGGLFSAFTGAGKGKREAFDTIAEGLVFSIGKTLLEQSGRGFTETEQENVRKKILGASLSKRDSEFFSKLNGVIRLVNNRIRVAAKKRGQSPQLIPSAEELIALNKTVDQSRATGGGLKVVSITQE